MQWPKEKDNGIKDDLQNITQKNKAWVTNKEKTIISH